MSPPSETETLHILGGGLAGLCCGAALVRQGRTVKVLEAQARVGGLAQSFHWKGYDCDLGPHRFHSNQEAIVDLIRAPLQENLHMRDRLSRIYLFKKYFYYPLRAANILGLPKLVLLKAGLDYWLMRIRLLFSDIPDDNFENYVRKRFGNSLYRIFFGTYTEKTWQIPPRKISADWAGQRITLLNLWDVVKKTLFRPKNVPRTYVSRFWYPIHGGIGAISEGYRRMIEEGGSEVLLECPLIGMKIRNHRVESITYTADGESVEESVERVVSTVPLNRLVEMMDPLPPAEVLQAAKDLQHKAILFVYIMLDREKVTDDHWVYLPERHLSVHRISEFKNFSEKTCPEGKTLLCAEITCSEGDAVWRKDDAALAETAVADLSGIGLFERTEVLDTRVEKVPYAYPLYDLEYRANLRVLLDFIKPIENLVSTGRQGLFRYGNMDHSVAMGARVAKTLEVGRGPDHAEVAADREESFD